MLSIYIQQKTTNIDTTKNNNTNTHQKKIKTILQLMQHIAKNYEYWNKTGSTLVDCVYV